MILLVLAVVAISFAVVHWTTAHFESMCVHDCVDELAEHSRPITATEIAEETRWPLWMVYSAMRSLERQGIVIGHWGKETPLERERDGRPRRYYELSRTFRGETG